MGFCSKIRWMIQDFREISWISGMFDHFGDRFLAIHKDETVQLCIPRYRAVAAPDVEGSAACRRVLPPRGSHLCPLCAFPAAWRAPLSSAVAQGGCSLVCSSSVLSFSLLCWWVAASGVTVGRVAPVFGLWLRLLRSAASRPWLCWHLVCGQQGVFGP